MNADGLEPVLEQIDKLWLGFDGKPTMLWGTVSSGNPVTVVLDGDVDAEPVPAQTAVMGLIAGDRVRCTKQNRRVIIEQVVRDPRLQLGRHVSDAASTGRAYFGTSPAPAGATGEMYFGMSPDLPIDTAQAYAFWLQAVGGSPLFRVRKDGHLDSPHGAYAMAAGSFTHAPNVGIGTFVDLAVSFPAGRFTVAPIVMASSSGVRLNVSAQEGVTESGCTLRVFNGTTGTAAGPNLIRWQAVQMTPTGASG